MVAVDSKIQLVDKDGNPISWKGTQKGDAFIAKRIPDFANLVSRGLVWSVQDTTTTAVLVAVPSTTSGLTVQNPASSGKHYVVFGLSAYVDVVPATLGLVSVFHCAHKLAVVPYTRDITLQATGAAAISGLKAGQGPYQGVIILDRAATVVDDGWTPTPLQVLNNIATTNFVANAAALIVPVVIPPGAHYSLQAIATVVTFEAGLGLIWAELELNDLE